ncbi:AraC family transcriptional regulator [Aquimarina sp. 2201CG5-10]|uniref:AraC family transcriptional regulator n=1 Tax=Aquimarina callyspongiae TaxID=3098150 RepID=UPI002AB412BB|nr:AraC family transcriptional regulator [Aquimarina sp. 2201CG5-10]MDY8136193.1 AraC family transcriptional regulator [Aquimarina sp. 2201CG5-10]
MRKITIPIILFTHLLVSYLSLGNIYSQNEQLATDSVKIDSSFITKESYKEVQEALEKVIQTDQDLGQKYFQIYLERGIRENDDHIQFISNYYLGDIAYTKGNYILAIRYGKTMLELAEKQKNDLNKVTAHNLIGNSYFEIRYYENALKEYLNAYKIVENNNFIDHKFQLLTNISNSKTKIGLYEESLASYEEIINLLDKKENKTIDNYYGTYLSSILGAGVCNFKLKNYDKAIEYYSKGYKLSNELEVTIYKVVFNMTIGEAYTEKTMYDQALSYLNKAEELINRKHKIFDPYFYTLNYHLATVFFKKGEYKKALDYLNKNFISIDSKENEKQIEKITDMYDLAQRCSEKLGDVNQQIYFGNAYKRIIDLRHKDDIQTRDQLYDYNLITLEEKNKDLLSQNSVYIIGLITALLLIIVLLFYHNRKQYQNKLAFKELQNKIEEPINKPIITAKKEFVTDKKVREIFDQLKTLESTNFFLAQDCNLYTTAKKINTNTTYLSKIMNEYREQSFNDYINELRIKHCCQQLNTNQKFLSYTIKAIAGELGYKSVNTFASAFKKHTGLTHSYYIKQIQKS